MLIHNAAITGSLTLNGIDIGDITGSESSIASLNQATASLSSSIAILSGSFLTTSASYSSASGSFSQRVTTIEGKYATTGSNSFNGSQTVTGSLTVTNQIVAQTLSVQQVTSSIIFSSGSNVFGNSLSNTQQLTGSVSITGSLSVNGTSAVVGTGTANYIPKFTNGSAIGNSLVYDSGTAVGIGTTSPTANTVLDVSTTGTRGYIIAQSTSVSAGSEGGLRVKTNTKDYYIFTDNTSDALRFYDGTASAERMRLTSGGNLLVNSTTDNGNRLQVTGNGYFSGNVGINTTTLGERLNVNGTIGLQNSGTQNWGIYTTSSNNLVFQRSGIADRMTLSSDGNLGLGVTPSAWSSFRKSMEIGALGNSIAGSTTSGVLELYANSYINTGGNYIYSTTSTAGLYQIDGNAHKWYNAPSGTAGNGITFTQAMTLTAAGRLLLGTTTEGTYLLDVNGGSRFTGASGQRILTLNAPTDGGQITFETGGTAYADMGSQKSILGSGSATDLYINTRSGYAFAIGTSNVARLSIDSTGAATFSSSVQAGNITTTTAAQTTLTIASTETSGRTWSLHTAGTTYGSGAGSFVIRNNGVDALVFNSSSAATFSSSVTATSLVKSGGTSSQYLMADGSTSTLTNPVTGTGTTNYITKWTSGSAIGNSAITDDGTTVTLVSRALSGTSATFTGNANADDYSMAVWKILDWNGVVAQIGGINASQWTQLEFFTSGTSKMALTSGGNLLLNSTTDNGNRLQVTGDGYFSGNVGIGTTPSYKLDIFDGGGASMVVGATTGKTYVYGDNAGGTIGTISAIPLRFATNSVERARIDSSGNLGLGVVPVASTLPYFDGGSNLMLSGRGNAYFHNNVVFDGGFKYIVNGAAAQYNISLGQHSWSTAPSGTAGNAITFTQAMTLTAAGRLLLGTTTEGTDLLQVNGTSKLGGVGINTTPTSSGTAQNYIRILNTGGDLYLGLESSTAGGFFTGSSAYASVLYSNTAQQFIIGGTKRFEIASTGAATFSSTVRVDGQVVYYAGTNTYVQGDNTDLYLGTGGVSRIKITSGGNCLVGTTTDSGEKLQVAGTAKFTGNVKATQYSPESTNNIAIPLNTTNYTIISSAFNGLVVIRDISFGGSCMYLLDINNGAALVSSNGLGYTLTFTYSSGTWLVQKNTGGSTTIYFNLISGV